MENYNITGTNVRVQGGARENRRFIDSNPPTLAHLVVLRLEHVGEVSCFLRDDDVIDERVAVRESQGQIGNEVKLVVVDTGRASKYIRGRTRHVV